MSFYLKFIAKTICLWSAVCCPLFSIKIVKFSPEIREILHKTLEAPENCVKFLGIIFIVFIAIFLAIYYGVYLLCTLGHNFHNFGNFQWSLLKIRIVLTIKKK